MIFNLAVHVHDTGSNGVTKIIGIMVELYATYIYFLDKNSFLFLKGIKTAFR